MKFLSYVAFCQGPAVGLMQRSLLMGCVTRCVGLAGKLAVPILKYFKPKSVQVGQ